MRLYKFELVILRKLVESKIAENNETICYLKNSNDDHYKTLIDDNERLMSIEQELTLMEDNR